MNNKSASIMKRIILLLLVASFILVSCNSQKSTTTATAKVQTENEEYDPNTVEVTQAEIPLEDYLRRFSGITVSGSGANARILVRSGGNSLTSGTEPLFLINGNQFNGDFKALSQTISVNDIKSIKVYKNASETSYFGVRGANGVIDIRLK